MQAPKCDRLLGSQFTLVNSVSTLLNKGEITCNCPKASQDFCFNQNKQAVHSYSAPVLCFPDTSEAKVGETAAKLKTALTQSAPLQGCCEDISGVLCSSCQLKNMSTCQNHATNMPRFMSMFVQAKTPINLNKDESKQKKTYFHRFVGAFGSFSSASAESAHEVSGKARAMSLPHLRINVAKK